MSNRASVRPGRTLHIGFLTLVMAAAAVSFRTPAALAQCGSNAIVCENFNAGSPSGEWDVSGAGDPSIQGFATAMSVNRGETVRFKINTDASSYSLAIYRMGYYGGSGARLIATINPAASLPQAQPD